MTRPSFSRIILPIIAVLGMILTAVIVFRGQPDRAAEAPDKTPPMTPEAQRKTGSVAGVGLIEPAGELVDIGTALGGIVEDLYVQPGDTVTSGQPLFRIDTRDTRAAIAEASARVESAARGAEAARTGLRVAQNELALFRNVQDARAVSRLEIVTREGAAANAQAQLALQLAQARTAQAELGRAQVDLARRTVRAPMTGKILQVNIRKGEFAPAGPAAGGGSQDPLMTMGAADPLHVRIDVDEDEAARVALGEAAIVSPRGDATRQVKVTFVRAEPQVKPKESLTNDASERVDVRVLQLIYALPADQQGLFVGQQVDAFIPARQRPKP
jgi:HlyD family secretion protein